MEFLAIYLLVVLMGSLMGLGFRRMNTRQVVRQPVTIRSRSRRQIGR